MRLSVLLLVAVLTAPAVNCLDFSVNGHYAFILMPENKTTSTPWIWFCPTLRGSYPNGNDYKIFNKLLSDGCAVAGIDVGESYGNATGRQLFTNFYNYIVPKYNLSPKVRFLTQSRGGLQALCWAEDCPDKVDCIAGIYSVCNLSSYPGLKKAALVNGSNPLDRAKNLRGIPIFIIHGDNDTLVPLEDNGMRLKGILGDSVRIITVKGKGHEETPVYFDSKELLGFLEAKLPHSNYNTSKMAAVT